MALAKISRSTASDAQRMVMEKNLRCAVRRKAQRNPQMSDPAGSQIPPLRACEKLSGDGGNSREEKHRDLHLGSFMKTPETVAY